LFAWSGIVDPYPIPQRKRLIFPNYEKDFPTKFNIQLGELQVCRNSQEVGAFRQHMDTALQNGGEPWVFAKVVSRMCNVTEGANEQCKLCLLRVP